MEEDEFDGEETLKDTATTEEEEDETGFMQGYLEEDEAKECSECGGAIRKEKLVVKEIEGETYSFCSKGCAEDYEESTG